MRAGNRSFRPVTKLPGTVVRRRIADCPRRSPSRSHGECKVTSHSLRACRGHRICRAAVAGCVRLPATQSEPAHAAWRLVPATDRRVGAMLLSAGGHTPAQKIRICSPRRDTGLPKGQDWSGRGLRLPAPTLFAALEVATGNRFDESTPCGPTTRPQEQRNWPADPSAGRCPGDRQPHGVLRVLTRVMRGRGSASADDGDDRPVRECLPWR